MIKKKPTFIPQIREKIEIEETLMGLLKEKFKLMNMRSEVRSKLHFCIAVGDHDEANINSKLLKSIEYKLKCVNYKIDNIYSDKPSQNLQALL